MMAERDKLMLLVLSVMTDGRMGAGEHSSELVVAPPAPPTLWRRFLSALGMGGKA